MNLSKEKLHTLAYNLNELCLNLDEHYDINNGGCCFVAACIAECLEKYGIEFSVLVYDCYENEFNEIDCSHYHYMIVFNNTIINNMSYCSGTLYTYVDSEMLFQHFIMLMLYRIQNLLMLFGLDQKLIIELKMDTVKKQQLVVNFIHML